jgi:glucan biosynthesis protein C
VAAKDLSRSDAARSVEQWASSRRLYLDNLKVVLIAAIIAIHGILGYDGVLEGWSYADVREVTLAPVTSALLIVVVAPFGLFMISLLFLVAGLLTPGSLDRKGPGRFARDRLLRLGVPFVVYVLLVQPTLMYAMAHPLGAAPGSYWEEYLGAEQRLDTGPLWFVGVLLIFSLAYAALVAVRRPAARVAPRELTPRDLVLVAAAVAPTSFLVRLVYPYGSESFTDLNLWQWPACIALFSLGIAMARQGWLAVVPPRLVRWSRTAVLLTLPVMAAVLLLAGVLDRGGDAMGGANALALLFTFAETALAVFGPVWMLGVAQRLLDRPIPWGPQLSRSAYGAFMVQTLFLIAIALLLRPVPLPAELKALLVAAGGVVTSYWFAWLLINRVPGVGRVL